ncbi:hypothetical protein [Corallococcus sp. 4LFB]|uniref:hypothetical protein n=1 Tax=Corallococcus sp. 4LFB TaxID=3383249 RepID=UPI0039752121
MSRHRDQPDDDGDSGSEAVTLRPLDTYLPLKKPGPESTLTERLGLAICRRIASGRTLRDAAAKEGTNEGVVQGWLTRARAAVAASEENLYTWFLVEYEHAAAHFRAALEDTVLDNIGNRQLNEKFIRWRLSVSDPKNYTVPREAVAPTGNGLGPLFELITPDEARAKLDDKLATFIAQHQKAEALKDAPPPAPSEDDDGE